MSTMTSSTKLRTKPPERDRNAAIKQFRPDWTLFIVTLLLVGFGVAMVYDASFAHAIDHNNGAWYFYGVRQAGFAVGGLLLMFLVMGLPYWKWEKVAVPMMIVWIGLLALVLVAGHNAQGAQRWIGYGPIKFQPSEFARLAVVLYLARVISARPSMMRDFWHGVAPAMALPMLAVAIVELQKDLGTAITLLGTILLMLFVGGAKARWVAAILVVCALLAGAMILRPGPHGYRQGRILSYLYPEQYKSAEGYQVEHGKIALGTGGVTGVGFGESREKIGYLPAQRTDFIFAVVGEEMGLIGGCATLMLFLVLVGRGFHIATRTTNPFGALLATGLAGMLAVQSLINIGVVTAVLPATGVPLPFLSYGGSSLVATLIGIGILLNISRYPFYQSHAKD